MTGTRFEDISPITWEHPSDAAALKALRALPGLDVVVSRSDDNGAFGERGGESS